ncbi:extracellular solute-binding protein [Chloroflexi bacterium TSY]|nr:extracellular solute-binding protein [Chloroflexi bacterium TSY]
MEKSSLSRRTFLRLAAGASVGVMAVACATAIPETNQVPDAEVAQLVTWSLGAGNEAFQKGLIEQFNDAHPEIKIEHDPALAGLDWLTEGMQKLRIALENQSGPDFIGGIDSGAALAAVVESEQVLDLTDTYKELGWDEMFPQLFIDRLTIDGKIYAAPINVETVGLFYNMDLFEELGLSVPETFSDYLTVLQVIKDAGYYGYAIGLAGGWPSAFMASEFMYTSAGSEYRSVLSGEKSWTDCERCLAGLNAFYGLVDAGFTNPEVLGIDQAQANDLFFQGQTAMTLSGPWTIEDIWEAEPDFTTGFFYMPPVDAETDITTFGGMGGSMLVNRSSEYKEEALEFMKWFFSDETAQTVLRDAGAIMPIPFTVPDDIDPLLTQVTEQTLANIDGVGFWPVTHLPPQVFRQMNQFIQGMMGEQLTPEQVLIEMENAHQTYLKEKEG